VSERTFRIPSKAGQPRENASKRRVDDSRSELTNAHPASSPIRFFATSNDPAVAFASPSSIVLPLFRRGETSDERTKQKAPKDKPSIPWCKSKSIRRSLLQGKGGSTWSFEKFRIQKLVVAGSTSQFKRD